MTGHYELAVTTVLARYGAGCDAHRLEALAEICENPAAARDLSLVKMVLCGFQPAGVAGAPDAYAMRRLPRFVDIFFSRSSTTTSTTSRPSATPASRQPASASPPSSGAHGQSSARPGARSSSTST
jgi:hypothetical protein